MSEMREKINRYEKKIAADHLTRLVAIKALKEAQKNGDREDAHEKADTALCDFLIGLGYRDIVMEYAKVGKWYA